MGRIARSRAGTFPTCTLAMLLFAASSLQAQQSTPQRPRITGIASVGYYVSDLPMSMVFWHEFLGFDESYRLKKPGTSEVSVAFFKINDQQQIEIFNQAPPAPPNRMNHLSFRVDSVDQMRDYLQSKGIEVQLGNAAETATGNQAIEIVDPDGTHIDFIQNPSNGMEARAVGRFMPASRISSQIYHVGFLVGNTRKATAFYEQILGFKEIWRGSSTPDELSWINMRVPDGADYIEFMLYRTLPASFGTQNHVSLAVPNMQQAIAALEARPADKSYARPLELRVGRNHKRQVNLYDPNGTRVELMEPYTVDGRPAASSTAPPPPPSHD